MRILASILVLSAICFNAVADNDWVNVMRTDYGTTRVTSKHTSEIKDITYQAAKDGTYETMIITDKNDNAEKVEMKSITEVKMGTNVPTLYIDIENGAEVVVKETYLNAVINFKGYGQFPDIVDQPTTIKGRGNSTWVQFPKKPYRLKLPSKVSIGGLKKAKNYALIANFIDCTMMRNAIGLKVAQLMGMPFTNHCVPINVVINGTYRGAYMLTEKVGINGASVDIDENVGILFELSAEYDENYRFKSTYYQLPVMVKDPDFSELQEKDLTGSYVADDVWNTWATDFQAFETAVRGYAGSHFSNYLDMESMANFFIVNNICGNHELCHPKSVYFHKLAPGNEYLYQAGPCWDFDWAFTFGGNFQEGVGSYSQVLLSDSNPGANFFKKIAQDSQFRMVYEERWNYFKTNVWPALLQYIDEYADQIEVSAYENGERWPQYCDYNHTSVKSTENFRNNVTTLKTWLTNRYNYLSTHSNYGLY